MDINDIVTTVIIQFALLHTSSLHIKFTLLSNNKFHLFNDVCATQSHWLVLLQLPTTWPSSKQLSHHHFNGWELRFYCTCVKLLSQNNNCSILMSHITTDCSQNLTIHNHLPSFRLSIRIVQHQLCSEDTVPA